MNFTITEVALLAVQILLIPFARHILETQKKEITNNLFTVLNEHYLGLEDLIERNQNNIEKLSSKLSHKAEIIAIRNKIVDCRLTDLESFLQKSNEFQARCKYPLEELDDSSLTL